MRHFFFVHWMILLELLTCQRVFVAVRASRILIVRRRGMNNDLKKILAHEYSDDCMVCRAQDVVAFSSVPAAAGWETANELPQYSVALNGAAQLLAAMIADGLSRSGVKEALKRLLGDLEAQIKEDGVFGGPTQGNA